MSGIKRNLNQRDIPYFLENLQQTKTILLSILLLLFFIFVVGYDWK